MQNPVGHPYFGNEQEDEPIKDGEGATREPWMTQGMVISQESGEDYFGE